MKYLCSIVLTCLAVFSVAAQDKPLVAVLPFTAVGVSEADVRGLTVLFETALQNTGAFVVIEQTKAGAILAAQERSLDECADELCAVQIGKMLSANQIVMGTVGRISTVVYLSLKLIDVVTGKNLRAVKTQGDDVKAMIALLDGLASQVADVEYIATIVFDDGEYTGQTKNGEPHGEGTYLYANGDRYEGEYEDGAHNGQGTRYFMNGDRYEGQWESDKANGYGAFYFGDGDRYEGQWKDGKRHGHGIYYFANGDRYTGEYAEGKMHGQGAYYFTNRDRYVGEYENDNMHGQGAYYWANGERYEGEFRDDRIAGGWVYRTDGSKEWRDE